MSRGMAATLAWVFFASTVFLAVSCQRAPESIAEGEICHRCRRVITEDRLAGEILTPDVPLKYKAPLCMARFVVSTPLSQRAHEPRLRGDLRARALAFPATVDDMNARDRRMVLEQRRGFPVDERVDFDVRRCALERREHRRRQQHVAVVAELRDEGAPDLRQRYGVLQIARHGRQQ